MSDEIKDCEVIRAMRVYGGGFVSALAEAARNADEENLQRIKKAFPEYWERYKNMAKVQKDTQ